MKYEYRKAVTADIIDHIRDNIEDYKYMFANRYDAEERLVYADELTTNDEEEDEE